MLNVIVAWILLAGIALIPLLILLAPLIVVSLLFRPERSERRYILWAMTAIALLYALFIGIFVYEVRWKVETVDTAVSEDGVYELLFQSIGEPGWPFGPTPGQLVLKKGDRTISSTRFKISDDGAPLRKGLWKVTWRTDHAEVILSGSEQLDGQFLLQFDGTVETLLLETKFGKEYKRTYATPKEEKEEAPEEYAPTPEEQRIIDGYRRLYSELSGDAPENAVITMGAKPTSSSCVIAEDDEGVDYLVYDRPSKDGRSGLYVRHYSKRNEDGTYSLSSAAIVERYAWAYADGSIRLASIGE